ncbi:hypothetical protein BC628DRAFT_1004589 [Trametes gibbosa]|nr:hypothetical protein BC628DRAFT_1004589 [Trametes gibbosa]
MRGERNQGECITLMLLPRPTGTIRMYSGRAPRASPGTRHSGGPVMYLELRHNATRCPGPPLALSLHIRSSIWDKARALGASLEKRTHAMESAHEPARAKDAYHITYQPQSLLPSNTTTFPLTFSDASACIDGTREWASGVAARPHCGFKSLVEDSRGWAQAPLWPSGPVPAVALPRRGSQLRPLVLGLTMSASLWHIIPSTLSGVGSL